VKKAIPELAMNRENESLHTVLIFRGRTFDFQHQGASGLNQILYYDYHVLSSRITKPI